MSSGRNLAEELSGTLSGVAERTASKRPDQAWVYVPVMHDPNLFEWLEREFGAVVVMDMIGLESAIS